MLCVSAKTHLFAYFMYYYQKTHIRLDWGLLVLYFRELVVEQAAIVSHVDVSTRWF